MEKYSRILHTAAIIGDVLIVVLAGGLSDHAITLYRNDPAGTAVMEA